MKEWITFWSLIFTVVLVPVSSIAAELWYSEYDSGLTAIAARDWDSAEVRLKTALALQPKQGRQVLAYGVRFIRYIPDYYLGVVYFNQAKYQDSLNHFQRIQKTGLVAQGNPEFSELSKMMQLANEKLQPITEQIDLAVTPPVILPEQPKAKEPQQTELQPRRLEEETRKREQFDDLTKKADLALSAKDFKRSREFVKQISDMGVDETKAGALRKQIDVEEKLNLLTNSVNKKDWVTAQNAAKQIASLDPKNPELIVLKPIIDQGLSELKILELEDRGLLAFFSGDYQQAISVLERVIVVKKDSAESWFYLGCSHAALGLLQGNQGQELLKKAQREFAQVRRFDPKFNSTPGLISPRILEFYQQEP